MKDLLLDWLSLRPLRMGWHGKVRRVRRYQGRWVVLYFDPRRTVDRLMLESLGREQAASRELFHA